MADTDGTTVQPGDASTTPTTGATSTTPEATPTPAAPSPEDVKIAELVSRKVAEELTKANAGHQATLREIQSAKDRAIAEVARVQQRARIAENALTGVRNRIAQDNPDVAKDMELEQLRGEKAANQMTAAEQADYQRRAEFHNNFYGSVTEFITSAGIDPNDKRLDYGNEPAQAGDYLGAQRKIQASVAKILKENAVKEKASHEAEIAKIKRELGIDVDSVETSTPVGGTLTGGIPTNMAAFKKWYKALTPKEAAAKEKEINAALDSGRIK